MLRVWSEHLAYGEARSRDVLELLARGGLHPIFAVRPDSDLEALAGLIGDVREAGMEFTIWPLLAEEVGYWPSVGNIERFARRVREDLAELERAGAQPDWVAFDLEPALEPEDGFAESIGRALRRGLSGGPVREPFDGAVATLRTTIESLARENIGSLAVTSPPAVADLGTAGAFWQRSLEIPWEPLGWDRVGVMAYGSMVSGYTGGRLGYPDVRAIHYEMFLRMRRHFGRRTHASLGLTGTGVFGDEPVYERPEQLARDVAAARAAAVDDIAIFCLEGLLEKPEPGRWVDAIAQATPRIPPSTLRAESVLVGSDLITRVLGGLGRLAP